MVFFPPSDVGSGEHAPLTCTKCARSPRNTPRVTFRRCRLSTSPHALRTLLGADPNSVELSRLTGLHESSFLETKSSKYGASDSAKQELCKDVAAMANGGGGLIAIGFEELNEVVGRPSPVDAADEVLRMQQVLASGIAPPCEAHIRAVPFTDDLGVIVVSVPPSSAAPHAVVEQSRLKYPIRDGATTRWIREAEVAERYRGRFAGETARTHRLQQLDSDLRERLTLSPGFAWLRIATTPSGSDRLPISLKGRTEMIDWLRANARRPWLTDGLINHVSTGYRRYVLSDGLKDGGDPYSAAAELHSDGSASIAINVGRVERPGSEAEALVVSDTLLSLAVASSLLLARDHSVRSNAYGTLDVSATVESGADAQVVHFRRFGAEPMPHSRPVRRTPHTLQSFTLDGLRSTQETLGAASAVATDLLSCFGFPECLQISPDGHIRRKYFESQLSELVRWAAANDVPVTDETV